MILHKEGYKTMTLVTIFLVVLNLIVANYLAFAFWPHLIFSIIFFLAILSFFRNPDRTLKSPNNKLVYAPADGKIVVIEETLESEYFNDKRKQVSIFMSPANVHVNRNPISGVVNYFKYHPGKYLVAWHPKSSTENERTTTVIDSGKEEILMRQIAGALAKRIVNYVDKGVNVVQGADMGFIKFGSRVDLFLPLDAKILVKHDQKVKGNRTVIAELS